MSDSLVEPLGIVLQLLGLLVTAAAWRRPVAMVESAPVFEKNPSITPYP